MSLTYPLEYSSWYDLVFHVLANLPVDPGKKQMADFLIEHIPVELLGLFRIALWSEAKAGYRELHREHIVPLYQKQIPVLENEFSTIVHEVKGLADARFKVSHPLRRFGRLLWPGKEPLIFIGLPDSELDVPVWAPVMQGCHEYVLSKVINLPGGFMGTERLHSTRASSEGYFYHMAPEIMALSIEARLFKEKYRDRF